MNDQRVAKNHNWRDRFDAVVVVACRVVGYGFLFEAVFTSDPNWTKGVVAMLFVVNANLIRVRNIGNHMSGRD